MSEAGTIARHAGTVYVGQVAVMAFGVTDTIVAGRYAEEALAALAIGSAIFITVYVSLMGVLQALLPIWAELHGRGQHKALGRSLRQSLYLFAAATVIGTAVLSSPEPLMRWTGVPPTMQGDVEQYLQVLALALPAALLFRLFSTFNQSIGKPKLVTWLQTGALAIKIPLSIWLTFGGLGLPPLGLVGCGWATLVVEVAMVLVGAVLLYKQPMYRRYRLWQKPEPIDRVQQLAFLRMGVPAGLAVLVEVTSFTLMALFIARLGTVATAAHQIAANLMALAYMAPLSLAIATSARTSFWLGQGKAELARRACALGLAMAGALACAVAAALVVGGRSLASLYSDDAAVATAAAALLGAVAAYHLADAIQTMCIFLLRSYRVTLAPLMIYCILLWGVGLAGGYALAYHGLGDLQPMNSPLAFWIASAAALALTAALFSLLLWRTVRRWR